MPNKDNKEYYGYEEWKSKRGVLRDNGVYTYLKSKK